MEHLGNSINGIGLGSGSIVECGIESNKLVGASISCPAILSSCVAGASVSVIRWNSEFDLGALFASYVEEVSNSCIFLPL